MRQRHLDLTGPRSRVKRRRRKRDEDQGHGRERRSVEEENSPDQDQDQDHPTHLPPGLLDHPRDQALAPGLGPDPTPVGPGVVQTQGQDLGLLNDL